MRALSPAVTRTLGALVFLLPFVTACDSDFRLELWRATLLPLNSAQIGSAATGVGEIQIDGNLFSALVAIEGADNTTHLQLLMNGGACPTGADDTNNDGYIDIVEGAAAYGRILIPLDANLAIRRPLAGIYPIGSAYSYVESAALTVMLDDLRLDPDTTNFYAVVGPNELLDVSGRAIVVAGTTSNLPASVQTIANLTAQQTLPVACGVLERF